MAGQRNRFRARQGKRYGVGQPIPAFVMAWGIAAIGLQVYNTLLAGVSWPYLFGVTGLLMNGFSAFLVLILRPFDDVIEWRYPYRPPTRQRNHE
ncbi:MAG: hypothetical protein R3E84_02305 [Pseudomonadales bacterium]